MQKSGYLVIASVFTALGITGLLGLGLAAITAASEAGRVTGIGMKIFRPQMPEKLNTVNEKAKGPRPTPVQGKVPAYFGKYCDWPCRIT